jgi:hypothetical protein
MDPIQTIKDYAREMGFQYWIDPEKRAWIEVHHHEGGARAYADGHVESAKNPKLRAVMERKLAEACIVEKESLAEPDDQNDAWMTIHGRLDELSNKQLTRLIECVRRIQVARESEQIATAGVS